MWEKFHHYKIYLAQLSTHSILSFLDFPTDYKNREKTLLLLIIKYWDSIWVIKYVLIKLPCNHYKKSGLLWRKSHDDQGIRH